MKKIILAVALAATATPSLAATRADAMHWELAYEALNVADAAETIYCLERNRGCEEANPLMGKHPSPAKVIVAKAILGGLHFVIVDHVARKSPKTALRIAQISVALQGAVVGLNARIVF